MHKLTSLHTHFFLHASAKYSGKKNAQSNEIINITPGPKHPFGQHPDPAVPEADKPVNTLILFVPQTLNGHHRISLV